MNMKKLLYTLSAFCAIACTAASCGNGTGHDIAIHSTDSAMKTGTTKISWGQTDQKDVFLYTLTNAGGAQVKITNYGGTITSWTNPDRSGHVSSIIIGFDSLNSYLQKPPYFGALIGRYGNRIGKAAFTLDGKTYKLAANNGKNSLHGGLKGFDKVVWDAKIPSDSVAALMLSYTSKDGEEGYPGTLQVTVKYSLSDEDELSIEYSAETDKATPVNLTNHSYFNLTGDVSNSILNHELMINAAGYTPVDSTLIPTGEIRKVKGTPFDFTKPKKIGAEIDAMKGGYDHNFVLDRRDSTLPLAAILSDSLSGRKIEVFTTEPGLQFYTGNFLDGKFFNHDGKPVNFRTALCMETQHFPDSPNKPSFPSTILKPGVHYHSLTKYRCSVRHD
jgi:aldose 1-epimerase